MISSRKEVWVGGRPGDGETVIGMGIGEGQLRTASFGGCDEEGGGITDDGAEAGAGGSGSTIDWEVVFVGGNDAVRRGVESTDIRVIGGENGMGGGGGA